MFIRSVALAGYAEAPTRRVESVISDVPGVNRRSLIGDYQIVTTQMIATSPGYECNPKSFP